MNSFDYQVSFAPGDIVAQRYRVEKVLGAGGMGVVVSARHLELDSLVAIKFLRPEALSNPEAVARFTREARAAVRIKSEHVARVMDVATLPNGSPYMVMEHLDGSDLSALVHSRGALPIDDVVDFVLQACEAIAEAHSVRIVHRDLKPGNLFLSRRADGSELVKVLDFGISKINDGIGANAAMTSTSALLGSPTYMSPEQLTSSRDVDARADIWALGVILFELLSGRVPFAADTMPMLCIAILQTPLPSLRSLRFDISPALEAVVSRCMEKDRANRYANIGQLAAALFEFAPSRSRISVERILRLSPGEKVAIGDANPLSAASAMPSDATRTFSVGLHTEKTWGKTAEREKPPALPGGSKLLRVAVAGGVVALLAAAWFAVQARRPSAELLVPPSIAAAPPPPATSETAQHAEKLMQPAIADPIAATPGIANRAAPGESNVAEPNAGNAPPAPATETSSTATHAHPHSSPRPAIKTPSGASHPAAIPSPAPAQPPAALPERSAPRAPKPTSDWDNDRN